jgi:hypothetical protein
MFSTVLAETVYALLSWTAGFIAVFRTDWLLSQALAIQDRFPRALSSQIAKRSWYPTFLRVAGAVCLLFALLSSLEVGLWIFAGRTVNPTWR